MQLAEQLEHARPLPREDQALTVCRALLPLAIQRAGDIDAAARIMLRIGDARAEALGQEALRAWAAVQSAQRLIGEYDDDL